MPSGGPSATRSALLARRARIRLASQGRDLLKDKRAALMREFSGLESDALTMLREQEVLAAAARRRLAEAVALDGPEAVGAAALATPHVLQARATSRNVAGVPVVELEHDRASRARSGASS
jgi:V/A-type H+-transporting ATPase subunit D